MMGYFYIMTYRKNTINSSCAKIILSLYNIFVKCKFFNKYVLKAMWIIKGVNLNNQKIWVDIYLLRFLFIVSIINYHLINIK